MKLWDKHNLDQYYDPEVGEIQCEICLKIVKGKQAHQKYCSANCKNKAKNERRKLLEFRDPDRYIYKKGKKVATRIEDICETT